MRRRKALKNIGIITAGLFFLPGCKDKLQLDWRTEGPIKFNEEQQNWIQVISEALLPKNELKLTTYESFPEFLSKMICFEKSPSEQQVFINGYNQCTLEMKELYDRNISDIQSSEIVTYFSNFIYSENPPSQSDPKQQLTWKDQKFFCQAIRQYSIDHLITSKEYQQDILNYQLIPVAYQACIPV